MILETELGPGVLIQDGGLRVSTRGNLLTRPSASSIPKVAGDRSVSTQAPGFLRWVPPNLLGKLLLFCFGAGTYLENFGRLSSVSIWALERKRSIENADQLINTSLHCSAPSETGRSALERPTEAAHSTVPVAQAMSHHHVGSSMLENLDFSSSFSPTHGHQTFRLLQGEGASGVTWAKESSWGSRTPADLGSQGIAKSLPSWGQKVVDFKKRMGTQL